ncbi:hypothetical protein [Halovenus sp. HT40]|uniref:hypothetical protein n=1 Tax=Halovenus sp. HT40 TaxID=3126691 RepID=UPI00300EF656
MTDGYTGADLFADALEQYNVEHVFGNPGTSPRNASDRLAQLEFDGADDLSTPMRLLFLSVGSVAMFGSLGPQPIGNLLQVVAAVAIAGLLLRARYVVGYDVERAENAPAGN